MTWNFLLIKGLSDIRVQIKFKLTLAISAISRLLRHFSGFATVHLLPSTRQGGEVRWGSRQTMYLTNSSSTLSHVMSIQLKIVLYFKFSFRDWPFRWKDRPLGVVGFGTSGACSRPLLRWFGSFKGPTTRLSNISMLAKKSLMNQIKKLSNPDAMIFLNIETPFLFGCTLACRIKFDMDPKRVRQAKLSRRHSRLILYGR